LMIQALRNKDNTDEKTKIREEIKTLALKFPIPDAFV
jgi:hypothetical protein